jgi:hypothetical protein
MKPFTLVVITSLVLLFIVPPAIANDFGWTKDFDIQAQNNPLGFKASLAKRFNLRYFQVNSIVNNSDSPSDAYILLSLAEMSQKPTSFVVEKYTLYKEKGWGYLALSLGIKLVSEEYRALKNDHDLYGSIKDAKAINSSYDRTMLIMLIKTTAP